MILNFYLRKHPPRGAMRSVERENLAKVHVLLKKRGVPNASRLDYHEAIQLLAKLIAEECGGHCMGKAATGHRLTTAGIAGDTSSDTQNRQSNRHTHRSDRRLKVETPAQMESIESRYQVNRTEAEHPLPA